MHTGISRAQATQDQAHTHAHVPTHPQQREYLAAQAGKDIQPVFVVQHKTTQAPPPQHPLSSVGAPAISASSKVGDTGVAR